MATLKTPVGSEDHVQGNVEKAAVVLVEFGDYQCPHCGHAYPIVQQVQKHFGEKLAFVFRNFPLSQIHEMAEAAAETAEFAATKNRFWEMHDAIFENQDQLGPEMLMDLARTLKLPERKLQLAWETREFQPRVKADFLSGARSGVNGTPTFFINSHRHDGAFEFEDLVAAIDARMQ